MYRVASKKLKGPSEALVVRAAGCNALIRASQIEDVVFLAQGAGRSKAKACIGVLSCDNGPVQLFSLDEHMAAPKWHLSSMIAHWVVVVQANGQSLGLVVEGLVGWGTLALSEDSAAGRDAGSAPELYVSLGADDTLKAQLVQVSAILSAPEEGSFFYV